MAKIIAFLVGLALVTGLGSALGNYLIKVLGTKITLYLAIAFVIVLLMALLGFYLYIKKLKSPDKIRLKKASPLPPESSHLAIMSANNFKLAKAKAINKEAFKIFFAMECHLKEFYKGYRIFAETSLGAFINIASASGDDIMQRNIYNAYGYKRIDFLIIDPLGYPALAIEYHGSGHGLSGNHKERDQVKRLVLQKANINLLEVEPKLSKEDLLHKMGSYLGNYHTKFNNSKAKII